MKFSVSILLSALVSYAMGIYTELPWWSFTFGIFIVQFFIPLKAWYSFLASFTGVFVCWFVVCLIINIQNNNVLSNKIALLFFNNQSLNWVLLIVSALIGGLIAGFAGIAGNYVQKLLRK
ncbi:MAG: hypothetical protein ORN58_00080 [Sediminibacterium sp.]|nr:hypothetical protein [Sediminibacterium sp.]